MIFATRRPVILNHAWLFVFMFSVLFNIIIIRVEGRAALVFRVHIFVYYVFNTLSFFSSFCVVGQQRLVNCGISRTDFDCISISTFCNRYNIVAFTHAWYE